MRVQVADMANERLELKSLRVLLACAKPHVVAVLRQVLGIAGVQDVELAADARAAIELLRHQCFDAVFCDEAVAGGDFGHAARRSDGLLDPMLPIFLIYAGPRRLDVAARDLGYTDVLTRPVSATTIMRKLRLAVERPRPFIVAQEFFGPDRRAEARAHSRREDRRKRQPKKIKIASAARGEIVEL